jgi:Protein of unknown function (DUF2752)
MSLISQRRILIRGTIFFAAVLLVCSLIFVLKAVPPTPSSLYPKCQFHLLTGLHCPGCGMTRSLHHLFNGRLPEALQNNLLTFVALPFVVVMMFRSLWYWMWDLPFPSKNRKRPWLFPLAIGIGMTVYGIVRNLPFAEFECLRPN